MAVCNTWLWHLLENGFKQINIERKLQHCIECDRQTSGNVDREQDVLVLLLEHEEMCGAEGNQHGSNGDEERAEAQEEHQGQAPPEVLGLFPRGQDGQEHDQGCHREAEADEGRDGEGVESRLPFQLRLSVLSASGHGAGGGEGDASD